MYQIVKRKNRILATSESLLIKNQLIEASLRNPIIPNPKMVLTTRPDFRCALPVATPTFSSLSRASAGRPSLHFPTRRLLSPLPSTTSFRLAALSTDAKLAASLEPAEKPPVCTADELHYVPVSNSNWRLALWRYHPSPQAPPRSHPLLLLSGVGTNAIGYDLSPESSFARHMSSQGFDTWILEVRGAGLSVDGTNSETIKQSSQSHALSKIEAGKVSSTGMQSNTPSSWEESDVSAISTVRVSSAEEQSNSTPKASSEADVSEKLTETFMRLSGRSSGFPIEDQSEGISTKLFDQISKLLEDSPLYEPFKEVRATVLSLLESRESSGIANQISDLSQRLVNIFDEAQRSVPPPLFDWQDRLTSIIEDIQKQVDLSVKYDWDFDHYLEEDVPAAVR